MATHQQKQIEVIDRIESRVKSNDLKFSIVTSVEDYENDPRVCLTSVHIPSDTLKQKIQDEIIKPLKEVLPVAYFYPPNSMHMTIKNIRVINDPPHFTKEVVAKAEQVFSEVIPSHNRFNVYFYRLLLFPNNLALVGTTDPELDEIFFDLDKKLNGAGIPDDKKYSNSRYFFSNMTLVRFPKTSDKFIEKVEEISKKIAFGSYTVDSVTLLTCNTVLKKRQIINTWDLKMNNLITTINYIVSRSTELKNKFTSALSAPVEFACIFCQDGKEYEEFSNSIEKLGKIVEKTQSGFTYLLDKPIGTTAGPLRLVKIRKPDKKRSERGDADFNTDYKNFKEKYQSDSRFELIKRETFEMIRLSHPKFDVMACFSNIPKSKNLS